MKKVLLSLFMVGFLLPFAVQAQSNTQYKAIITHDTALCDSLKWIDGNTYTNDTTLTYVNATKDTLFLLNLTVWHSHKEPIKTINTTCGYKIGDMVYYENGTYSDTLKTIHQCDSIISISLNITGTDVKVDSVVSGCKSYTWVAKRDSITQNHLGEDSTVYYTEKLYIQNDTSFTDTIKTANHKCDTIVSLAINIADLVHKTAPDTVFNKCNTYSYRYVASGKLKKVYSDTILYDTVAKYNRADKCYDSIQKVTINLRKDAFHVIDTTVCGSFTYNKKDYFYSEIDTIKAAKTNDIFRCDSSIVLDITIHQIPNISIKIKDDKWELTKGDTAYLSVACDMDRKNVKYLWQYPGSKDNDTSNVQFVMGDKNVEVQLTATTNQGCMASTWLTVTSYVNIEGATNADINIYPNPTSKFINIQSNSNINHVTIYNAIGQQIINNDKLGTQNRIDLSSLTNGNYTIRMTLEDGTIITRKFIINK